MARPNPQYPKGKNSADKRDDAQYQEDKERLENQEEDDSVPKKNKH